MHGFDVSSYSAIFTATSLSCGLVGVRAPGWRVYAGLFVRGLFAGLAFMTKPSIALEIPALCVLPVFAHQSRRWRTLFVFVVGIAVSLGLIMLYFAVKGDLYDMLYITFAANFAYVGLNPFGLELRPSSPDHMEFVRTIFLRLTLPYYAPLMILALVSLLACLLDSANRFALVAAAFWAVSAFANSALALALDVRYFAHIIAPLALLGALLFNRRSLLAR